MPSNLVAATVRQGLYTRIVGRRLLYYPELSSTMDEAAKLGEGDSEEGAVVVAEVMVDKSCILLALQSSGVCLLGYIGFLSH